jgi:hypothetical protein
MATKDITNKEELMKTFHYHLEILYKKYEGNEYMIQRIYNHVVNYLPNTLENEYQNFEKRQKRNTYLTNEQQLFIQLFLSKNKYYYLPINNCFYEYNDINYKIVKDDEIIHNLLSNISKERKLMAWKHKTKFNILKQIKEKNLLSSIPETDTIQNVLNLLFPSIFINKNHAKYFLTIIGDNILKKNTNIMFIVSPKVKRLLYELDSIGYISIGVNNISSNFLTKYHENHSYDNYRLMKFNENFSIDLWKDILRKFGLDIFCVSTHYSNRHKNSDHFIDTKSDEELKHFTYYLKNTSQLELVNKFCDKYLIPVNNTLIGEENVTHKIEWKNIHFIWKQFLSNESIPNMIYSNGLKNLLKERYIFDETSDSFTGLISKYLPVESDFIQFWENTILVNQQNSKYDDKENISIVHFINELELDELCMLFKCWVKQTESLSLLSNGNISEETILKIMKHFYPNIHIVEDKYILNIECMLWNKIKDIMDSFIFIKNEIKKNYQLDLLSFDDAYNYYFKFCNNHSQKFIVNKRYFEKFLKIHIQDQIVYEKFIKINWIFQYGINNEEKC